MNKSKPPEPDGIIILRRTIDFLNKELINSYKIIKRLNDRCAYLSNKLAEKSKKIA